MTKKNKNCKSTENQSQSKTATVTGEGEQQAEVEQSVVFFEVAWPKEMGPARTTETHYKVACSHLTTLQQLSSSCDELRAGVGASWHLVSTTYPLLSTLHWWHIDHPEGSYTQKIKLFKCHNTGHGWMGINQYRGTWTNFKITWPTETNLMWWSFNKALHTQAGTLPNGPLIMVLHQNTIFFSYYSTSQSWQA